MTDAPMHAVLSNNHVHIFEGLIIYQLMILCQVQPTQIDFRYISEDHHPLEDDATEFSTNINGKAYCPVGRLDRWYKE